MHELGIIVHITKTLGELAVENKLTNIASVTLEIGEVAGSFRIISQTAGSITGRGMS